MIGRRGWVHICYMKYLLRGSGSQAEIKNGGVTILDLAVNRGIHFSVFNNLEFMLHFRRKAVSIYQF